MTFYEFRNKVRDMDSDITNAQIKRAYYNEHYTTLEKAVELVLARKILKQVFAKYPNFRRMPVEEQQRIYNEYRDTILQTYVQ